MTDATKPQNRQRPISPHLQAWRPHVTMITSITHRITGVGNTLGLILALAWIGAIAAGPDAYQLYTNLLGSFLGRLVLFGCLWSMSYHIINGVRHLFFNLGIGLTKEVATKTAWLAIILSVVGACAMYMLGIMALAK